MGLAGLTGWDELAVTGADPAAARAVVERVFLDETGRPLELGDWRISDVDRLHAVLHDHLYGDRLECRSACTECGEGFDFELSLAALLAEQDAERPPAPDADGTWPVAGRRVRAPRLADLDAARTAAELLARLVVEGEASDTGAEVTRFLERAAPVLDLELDAACPECGSAGTPRFDLATFLAARLAAERPFLVRETHWIASRYGWSHDEIMSLPREDRRAYAGLVEAERSAHARRTAV